MAAKKSNSYNSQRTLTVAGTAYYYHSLEAFSENAGLDISQLPYSLKILLENLLRREDGITVKKEDIDAVARWDAQLVSDNEIQFMPARILLQDFTGVPAVADLAAMRSALKALGGEPSRINPIQPADLIIDHSVQVDSYGTESALETNSKLEFERNHERYQFLRWGQSAFTNFRVVPPETGICHQVNLEYLSQVAVVAQIHDETWVFPDTLVGTDSHTTMINGLGVVGWGVGGIEAEAAMLGQPCSMLIPQVVGLRLTGALKPGATATDLVLTITQLLRRKGVVGKFVEFFGPGAASLSIADRATIGNMSPEYGATIGIFPVDEQTIAYLRLTGRESIAPLVEAYYRQQGLWRSPVQPEPVFSDTLELDLGDVEPSLAGPTRPMDRVRLKEVRSSFRKQLVSLRQADAETIDTETLSRWLGDDGSPVTVTPELMAVHPDKEFGALGRSDLSGPDEPREAGAAAGRQRLQPVPWFHRHCRHHELHQYFQSRRDDRSRSFGQKCRTARTTGPAMGKNESCTRLEGRHRLPERCGTYALPGSSAVPSGRLRLYDLYRQQRAARRAYRPSGCRWRAGRCGGPFRQP